MKQAILVLSDAGDKTTNGMKGAIDRVLSQSFPDLIFKSFSYQSDHPEEVTYHLGQMVKFLAANNGQGQPPIEQLSEEQKTWRKEISAFWEMAKPELRKFAKEIWYTKKQLQEMEQGKKASSRISTSSVKFKGREENGTENIQA